MAIKPLRDLEIVQTSPTNTLYNNLLHNEIENIVIKVNEIIKVLNKRTGKPRANDKIKVASHVLLKQSEIDTLLTLHGERNYKKMVETLNNYKFTSGRTYANDYGVFRIDNWVIKRMKQEGTYEERNAPQEKEIIL